MTVEDALRKIALLRRVSADKGALAAERETAHRLQKVLMERYAIKAQEVPEGPPHDTLSLKLGLLAGTARRVRPEAEPLWRSRQRRGRQQHDRLHQARHQPMVDREKTPRGWQTTVRDNGLDSLRSLSQRARAKDLLLLDRRPPQPLARSAAVLRFSPSARLNLRLPSFMTLDATQALEMRRQCGK